MENETLEARLERLSHAELLASLERAVADERGSVVVVLKHLNAVELRTALDGTSYASLFVYCTRKLGYSEGEAYRRIHAARAARKYRLIYALLVRRRISLTTVSLLAPQLCRENHRDLLERAAGLGRRETERLVASLEPRRETADRIIHLGPRPDPGTEREAVEASGQADLPAAAGSQAASMPRPACAPAQADPAEQAAALPRRVSLKFTADEALLEKIRRARALLRHKHPSGRLEFVLYEALEDLLDKRDPIRRHERRVRRRKRMALPRERDRCTLWVEPREAL